MRRRKLYRPNAIHGADGEFRQEQIDSAVASYLRADGARTYHQSYEAAKRKLEAGENSEKIRQALHNEPDLQTYSGEDSPPTSDYKKIHNRVQHYLSRIADQAVDDALLGRPSNYQSPPGY
ncbi:MAG: hypothetical protein KDA84_05810 [Planctomycetaceae bacterium]|nr:hypothetical protein [Planctomycetaceae bacterium]